MTSHLGGGPPETPADVDFRRHRIEPNELLRAAFIDGAEKHSLRTKGRGPEDDKLREAVEEYPGDLPIECVTRIEASAAASRSSRPSIGIS
jgi:hypothetical protein